MKIEKYELEELKKLLVNENVLFELNIIPQIIVNKDRIILHTNKKFLKLFGYKKDEIVGLKTAILTPSKAKFYEYEKYFYKTKEGILISEELEYKKKDGSLFWVKLEGNTINIQNKELFVLWSFIDMSKEIEYRNKILEQQKKLFQSDKMAAIGEMIENIAHHWRQPLSVISTTVTGIIMQKEYGRIDDSKLIEVCNLINEKSQYLSKTINELSDFVNYEKKQTIFKLSQEIQRLLYLIEGSIKYNNLNIILNLDDSIKINGHNNKLIQCLLNIFNNSKDALLNNNENNRNIFISTYLEDEEVIISFLDNAGGIAEDIITKVFDPYFTTKHQSQGTGLGLNMTYKLIESIGGTINVNNRKFKYRDNNYIGAEFIITIPLNL